MKVKIDKIEDIPKFNVGTHYSVNMGLSSLRDQINEYLKYGLDLQPKFQRIVRWTRNQKIGYVEFMLRGGITANDLYFNHKRMDIDWQTTKESGDFVIVDGRNRLRALLDFVDDELPVFKTKLSDWDKPHELLRARHSLKVHINSLKTDREALQWYIDLNSKGKAHTEQDIAKVCAMMDEL